MDKKTKNFLLRSIFALHVLIVLIGVAGLFLIFLDKFRNFYIFFYLVVIGSGIIFRANCPLTLMEDELRKSLGKKVDDDNFINRLLKKYFKFVVPGKVIEGIMLTYFVLALIFVLK